MLRGSRSLALWSATMMTFLLGIRLVGLGLSCGVVGRCRRPTLPAHGVYRDFHCWHGCEQFSSAKEIANTDTHPAAVRPGGTTCEGRSSCAVLDLDWRQGAHPRVGGAPLVFPWLFFFPQALAWCSGVERHLWGRRVTPPSWRLRCLLPLRHWEDCSAVQA